MIILKILLSFLMTLCFLGVGVAGPRDGCWQAISSTQIARDGQQKERGNNFVFLFYGDDYLSNIRLSTGEWGSDWTHFTLTPLGGQDRYQRREICTDFGARRDCDYKGLDARPLTISQSPPNELVLLFEPTDRFLASVIKFSKVNDSACRAAFPPTVSQLAFDLIAPKKVISIRNKDLEERLAKIDSERAAEAAAETAAVARREKVRSQSPKVIGIQVFSADQVRRSVSLGGGCRPWINGRPSFVPNSENSFFHTIEILPNISAAEAGGRVAMVVPRTAKVYPAKLTFTDFDGSGDTSGWVKGYFYKDSFGDVKCIDN